MTTFYTYIHTRNDSGAIFYVGKGKNDRAHFKPGRSTHWNRIVEKHGYTAQILDHFESESDSFAHERYLIASLRACGVPICNMTEGGDGGAAVGAGRKPADEPTKARGIRMSDRQAAAFQALGGSPWLQGLLNLEIRRQGVKAS